MGKLDQLEKFNNIKGQDYSRKGEDFEFIEANRKLKIIEEFLEGATHFIDANSNETNEIESTVASALKDFHEFTQQILNIKNANKPTELKKQISSQVDTYFRDFFTNSGKYSIIISLSNRAQLNSLTPENLDNILKQIKTEKQEAEKLKEDAKSFTAEKITSGYASLFSEESKRYRIFGTSEPRIGISGYYLLGGLLLIGALSVILLYTNFLDYDSETIEKLDYLLQSDNLSGWNTITVALPDLIKKLIILSLFIFGIRFCFKNFSLSQHQSILNKQKSIALESINLLHRAVEGDAKQKNNLLIEVSKIIYSPVETGHVDNKNSKSELVINPLQQYLSKEGK